MSLRWYSTVIDCHDVASQAKWWAEAIGWKPVYEADDEVVLVPSYVTEELLAATPWDQVGPGLVFVSGARGQDAEEPAPHRSRAAHLRRS